MAEKPFAKWGGHHPWLGHGDISPSAPHPEPGFGDRVGAKIDKTIQKGVDWVKNNPGKVASRALVGAARAVSAPVAVAAEVLLSPTEAGAGSDKVPMKNVDNSGLKVEKP